MVKSSIIVISVRAFQLFLHGNNLSGNYFGKQGILYRDYRLIFIDSRNHGRSSRQSVKMTFEQMVADLDVNFAIFEYQEGLICRS